jgi:hypothetical protein
VILSTRFVINFSKVDQPPPVNRYSKPGDNYNNAPYPPNQPYYDNNPMPAFNNGPPPVDRNSRMLQPDPHYYPPNMMPNQGKYYDNIVLVI